MTFTELNNRHFPVLEVGAVVQAVAVTTELQERKGGLEEFFLARKFIRDPVEEVVALKRGGNDEIRGFA